MLAKMGSFFPTSHPFLKPLSLFHNGELPKKNRRPYINNLGWVKSSKKSIPTNSAKTPQYGDVVRELTANGILDTGFLGLFQNKLNKHI